MKIAIALTLLLAAPLSAHALPEGMQQSLLEARMGYVDYSKKSADEILDHQYDESEIGFLAHLGLGGMFQAAAESMDETVEYDLQTVKDLAGTFKTSQLEALLEATRESGEQFNNDRESIQRDVTMIDLALQYKKSKLNDASLKEVLSEKFSPKRSES